jgi:ribosome-associated heat shock protein Hsp15
VDSIRVDRWLWAVRLVKTRSAATDACRAGHVRVNGSRVKPAQAVKVGDTVRVRSGQRERIVEVARIIDKRVGAPVAAECLVDHSPPPPPRAVQPDVPRREPGTGRPTKRERRQLDRSRGRRGR